MDRNNKPICFAYNNGSCKGVCPKNMTHCCQLCLGAHPAKALDGQGEIEAKAKRGREQATVLFQALFADLANLIQRAKEKLSTYGEVLDR